MNAASEPARPSIMARVARVRKRMQIEVNTGIPASSKALFLPLCQDYEQRDEPYFYTRTGYSGLSKTEQSLPSAALRRKDSLLLQRKDIVKFVISDNSVQYPDTAKFNDFTDFTDWSNTPPRLH